MSITTMPAVDPHRSLWLRSQAEIKREVIRLHLVEGSVRGSLIIITEPTSVVATIFSGSEHQILEDPLVVLLDPKRAAVFIDSLPADAREHVQDALQHHGSTEGIVVISIPADAQPAVGIIELIDRRQVH